jgi:hypothetical protein
MHAGSKQAATSSVSIRRVFKGLGIAILLILAVLFMLPWLRRSGVIPTPRFAVENSGGAEACTVLGDYCLRVQCAVTNAGNGSGSIRISAELVPDHGSPIAHYDTRVVAAGQRQVVSFDFPEAELGRHYSYRCGGQPGP